MEVIYHSQVVPITTSHKLNSPQLPLPSFDSPSFDQEQDRDTQCTLLSKKIESGLRAAKSRHLACGEVLLPPDLLYQIANDVLIKADMELCGIRGCMLFLNIEDDQVCRKIGSVQVDPYTVPTFELHLTLKHDTSSLFNMLPQFIKNLARSSTIVISPEYSLFKKKLYRTH